MIQVYWETRGTRRYLYRTVREGGRAFRVYLGTGPAAEILAAADDIDRKQRRQTREQVAALRQQVQAVIDPVHAFNEELDILMRGCLFAAGYHDCHGQWWRNYHAKQEQAD